MRLQNLKEISYCLRISVGLLPSRLRLQQKMLNLRHHTHNPEGVSISSSIISAKWDMRLLFAEHLINDPSE